MFHTLLQEGSNINIRNAHVCRGLGVQKRTNVLYRYVYIYALNLMLNETGRRRKNLEKPDTRPGYDIRTCVVPSCITKENNTWTRQHSPTVFETRFKIVRAYLCVPSTLLLPLRTPMLACICLLYTSPSPRDRQKSRMPSSA